MNATCKAKLLHFWREYARPIAAVVLVLSTFRSAVADWNVVPTGSMEPTILKGDRIFVNKLAYDLKVPFLGWQVVQWGEPERGEVVVFFSPENGQRMVKRVVGLPGDVVEVRHGQLWLNGEPLEYEPLDPAVVDEIAPAERPAHHFAAEVLGERTHAVMATPASGAPTFFGPVRVPEGHFFMMGDSRDNSYDSRWFGFVERSAVVGEATRVVISLDRENSYQPRWGRFFQSLE